LELDAGALKFETISGEVTRVETSYIALTLAASPLVPMSRCKSGILGKRRWQADDGKYMKRQSSLAKPKTGIQGEPLLARLEHRDASI
jgi:hypothetical protein